jgi:hypothetical protein
MSHDIPLAERLAGFLPDEPAPVPYSVPQQAPYPPDASRATWHAEAPTSAPRRSSRATDPTVVVTPLPTRRVVPATGPRPVAATSAVPPWEWDDRRGMRVAVLVASITLVLGAAAAGVILLRGQQPVAETASAPDPVLPVPAEVVSIPALDAGIGGGLKNPVIAGVPASISPVTAPPATTSTTRKVATTQKPPVSQAVVAAPKPTLNPPSPPVKPTRVPNTTTSTAPQATSTTATTTKPAPTTTTTTRGNANTR